MIRITVKIAGQAKKEITGGSELLTLGRAPTSTILFGDRRVSWQHGQIAFRQGGYWYRDLHSTNGSFLQREDKSLPLGEKDFEQQLTAGDVVFLGSEENAIEISEIAEDVAAGRDLDTPILIGEATDLKSIEEVLSKDNEALRNLIRLARSLSEIRDKQSVAQHIAEALCQVLAPVQRTVVFETRVADFVPLGAAPVSTDQRPEAIAKSMTLLNKVARERRGLVYVVHEDSIRAVASDVQALSMRKSAQQFINKAVLCCPLIFGKDCCGVIQVESEPCAKPEDVFTQRDLALTTMMAHLAAARIHDLEHHQSQLKIQRKATVGMITSWICHDLRNLLQIPLSLASVIPILLRKDPEGQLKTVLLRNRACIEVMNVILHEITDVAKDMTTQLSECDLLAALSETVEYLQKMDPDHLLIAIQAESPLPPIVCNPVAVQRLVLNLGLNAADAIAESDRRHEGRITLTCRYMPEPDELVMELKDNGPGIPDDILDEMQFMYDHIQDSEGRLRDVEDFAEKSKSRKLKKGKGLGFLFVCQTIVAHKGRMNIETGPNGTTFTIRLPRAGPKGLLREMVAETGPAETRSTQKVRIDRSKLH